MDATHPSPRTTSFQPGHGPATAPERLAPDRLVADPLASARERALEAEGVHALASQDLLAVLIGRGGRRTPARIALDLLESYGSLRRLAQAGTRELTVRHGLGRQTARRVVSALALGFRAAGEPLARGRRLGSSADIFAAFHLRLRDMQKERFLIVLLDGKNRVLSEIQVSEGILTASLVHPREVFEPAIRASAAGIVLIHNHPSGDPEPSPEDMEVTRRLSAVGDLVGIRVFDHVVIGDGRYTSFLERGLLPL